MLWKTTNSQKNKNENKGCKISSVPDIAS